MGRIKLILGASGLLFSSIANAAIITSSYMNSLEEVPLFGNPKHQTMTLNMFDSSLGTLNYALFSWQLEGQVSLILHNDSPASVTFDYVAEMVAQTEDFDNAPYIAVGLSQRGVTLNAGGSQDFGTYGATYEHRKVLLDYNYPGFTDSSGTPWFPARLSKSGGGTFETGCQLNYDNWISKFSLTGPPQIEASAVTWGACGATIEYHFTKASVPEPSAILLLGIGMIGLIGFTKRRKAA